MTSLRRHFHGERESGLIGSWFPGLRGHRSRSEGARRLVAVRLARTQGRGRGAASGGGCDHTQPGLATCFLIQKEDSLWPLHRSRKSHIQSERESPLFSLSPACGYSFTCDLLE